MSREVLEAERDGAAPYALVRHAHLQLDEPRALRLEGMERGLLIFWSDERPVAQLWVTPEARPDADAIGAALAHAPLLRPSPLAQGRAPSVSVVICTRDRPGDLGRCLAGLPAQTRPADEVVVVDNASRDGEARRLAEAAGARYVREDRPGLDIARNAGWRAARCDIVAYTDDDVEPHPRWLENLAAAFDDEDVLAVTGLVLPATLDTKAQWIFERGWSFGRGFNRRDFDATYYRETRGRGCPAWRIGAGANMAFRREARTRVGLFDERLDAGAAGCSGDSEFWHRLLAAGATCRYEPAAVVFHHHRADMAGLARQLRHYMRGHVAALLVQFERSGDPGDLVRAFGVLPAHYGRRLLGRLVGRAADQDVFLRDQIVGAASGVAYYLGSKGAA